MFDKFIAFWNSYLNEWPRFMALYIIQEKNIGVHILVEYEIGGWISVECEKQIYSVKWIFARTCIQSICVCIYNKIC